MHGYAWCSNYRGHGMPGGATAVTQNLGVATVQAGMASSQVNVAAGPSGHNPSRSESWK